MTNTLPYKKRRIATTLFGIMVFFILLLLLKNPDVASECTKRGLSLCGQTVIPALFPFMVLSELLISLGFVEMFSKYLGHPIAACFGLSKKGASVLFFGLLCGFPVGARMSLRLYDDGQISREECERLLGFSNLPSMAFLISAVGGSLYQNHAFGVFLWLSSLISACLVGLLSRKKGAACQQDPLPTRPTKGFSAFVSAITHSIGSMLTVCAYILFFSAVIGCLSHVFTAWNLPPILTAFLYSFFELTSGTAAAAALSHSLPSALLCALAVGWSGLSVHCQLLTLCDGRGLSFRPYFLAKALSALICTLLTLCLYPCLF